MPQPAARPLMPPGPMPPGSYLMPQLLVAVHMEALRLMLTRVAAGTTAIVAISESRARGPCAHELVPVELVGLAPVELEVAGRDDHRRDRRHRRCLRVARAGSLVPPGPNLMPLGSGAASGTMPPGSVLLKSGVSMTLRADANCAAISNFSALEGLDFVAVLLVPPEFSSERSALRRLAAPAPAHRIDAPVV